MQIAHDDQVPVFVRANPTIEALIAAGNALVSRVMISADGVCICMVLEGIGSRTPCTWRNR
jgi:hypothetical protein